jgi:hypothetical protein
MPTANVGLPPVNADKLSYRGVRVAQLNDKKVKLLRKGGQKNIGAN